MSFFRLLGILTILFSIFIAPAWCQRGGVCCLPSEPAEKHTEQLQHQMQQQRQKQRAEAMKRDSQKLLEIATELKQYVDKAGENVLSLEVVRKAEEMERLARQVKNNMRGE